MEDDGKVYIAPSLFVNHGGGPNPVLGEKNNLEIAKSLKEVQKVVDLTRLKAIILVTAHWEADQVSISTNEHHDLLFDYYNFPPESYKYKYEGRGDPELARNIHDALTKAQINSRLDNERGWDHGVFIPMMLMRPEADIPIVQVSILYNQDAKLHYNIGKVLREFRKKGVAVIGSGLSYHNMRRLKACRTEKNEYIENREFDDFLSGVCTSDEAIREKIIHWKEASGALDCHPDGEADHLMPLIVAAGAGGNSKGRKVFETAFYNRFLLSNLLWE
ncbi:unnamed protein product [Diatraea saccharalis]|uniref:Extradiol ring-cleavage dioxygenase class III enzyme subunit B domain-containing protein n=1 Tax=Diatraea saccharalis TaxID=40085 RepID=A0A9N9R5S2_9NEOP|nr:unnamed protein product [Diatraea saccharalis]